MMVAVAPANYLSEPLSHMRRLLAASTAFQTWCGAADSTAALASIHYITAERSETLPLVVVDFGDDWHDERIADGAIRDGGSVTLRFVAAVDSTKTISDQVLDFTNTLGGILENVRAIAGTDDYLSIRSVSKSSGPTLGDDIEVDGTVGADEENSPCLVGIVFEVTWD